MTKTGKLLDNRSGSSVDAAVTADLSNLHNVFSLKEEYKNNSTKDFSSLSTDFGESLMENCIARQGGSAVIPHTNRMPFAVTSLLNEQRRNLIGPGLIVTDNKVLPPPNVFEGLFFFPDAHMKKNPRDSGHIPSSVSD